jgi:hypothetical protein
VSYDAALAGVYIEWNEKLSTELYRTYKEGRSDKDPSEYWYEGKIGFFDFYIIPLAQETKLSESLVSRVTEYLNYAKNNRNEWEGRKKGAIKGYVKQYLEDEDVEIVLPALPEVCCQAFDKATSSLTLPTKSHYFSQ